MNFVDKVNATAQDSSTMQHPTSPTDHPLRSAAFRPIATMEAYWAIARALLLVRRASAVTNLEEVLDALLVDALGTAGLVVGQDLRDAENAERCLREDCSEARSAPPVEPTLPLGSVLAVCALHGLQTCVLVGPMIAPHAVQCPAAALAAVPKERCGVFVCDAETRIFLTFTGDLYLGERGQERLAKNTSQWLPLLLEDDPNVAAMLAAFTAAR